MSDADLLKTDERRTLTAIHIAQHFFNCDFASSEPIRQHGATEPQTFVRSQRATTEHVDAS